jgi:hypothetical protein
MGFFLSSISRYSFVKNIFGQYDYAYTIVDTEHTLNCLYDHHSSVFAKSEAEARARIWLHHQFFHVDLEKCLTRKAEKEIDKLKHRQLEFNLKTDA